MLDNGLSMGKKTPKLPSLWDFVTLPEEDRATAIGNMDKKTGKNRACGTVPEISSRTERQTDTHTDILITILPPPPLMGAK